MQEILIIEDEKDIVSAIEYNLLKEGFKVFKAFDGESGLSLIKEKLPNLVILDIMLPNVSGFDLCKILKNNPKTQNIPIIMLTARVDETDRVVGLELGADDYIIKPFSMRELIVRIKNILKRYNNNKKEEKTDKNILKFHNLEINHDKHLVLVLGHNVFLTAKEFALLEYLAENKGKVFSREKLLDHIWGIDVAVETRTVDVHIRHLREKLKKAGEYIHTLRGVGYKFGD